MDDLAEGPSCDDEDDDEEEEEKEEEEEEEEEGCRVSGWAPLWTGCGPM